jgi:hypothetical protein
MEKIVSTMDKTNNSLLTTFYNAVMIKKFEPTAGAVFE